MFVNFNSKDIIIIIIILYCILILQLINKWFFILNETSDVNMVKFVLIEAEWTVFV